MAILFHRTPAAHSRYMSMERPSSAFAKVDNNDEARTQIVEEYSDFLRNHERLVTHDGFVDSRRLARVFERGTKCSDEEKTIPSSRGKLRSFSVVSSMRMKTEKENEEYESKLKKIEDFMWKHKQKERELKRTEGKVMKSQREVKKTLRDYERAVNKRKLSEEKKLHHGLEKYSDLVNADLHNKKQNCKRHTLEKIGDLQDDKDRGSKHLSQINELSNLYACTIGALKLSRLQTDRLSVEFENKLRRKEEEQQKLKEKLFEVALSLNMEASKARQRQDNALKKATEDERKRTETALDDDTNLQEKLAKGTKDVRIAEATRRKLDLDAQTTLERLAIRQRDESRQLLDTRNNLAKNITVQMGLLKKAEEASTDHSLKEIYQNLELREVRKRQLINANISNRNQDEQAELETVFIDRYRSRCLEQRRRQHEDSLKHYQRIVNAGEGEEQRLYARVRESHILREKFAQELTSLKDVLRTQGRNNSQRMLGSVKAINMGETRLKQLIQRKQSELAKVVAQREADCQSLLERRARLKVDKEALKVCQNEDTRLKVIESSRES